MKKHFKNCMMGLLFGLLSFSSSAQDKSPKPRAWVSDKGYWIVENNRNVPLEHKISFYNNQDILIGQKLLAGVRLNTRKRKVKMMLKQALESSALAWEKKSRTGNEEELAQSRLHPH